MTMWQCDNVTMWQFDNVTMWQCDNVTMWQCDDVTMWQFAIKTHKAVNYVQVWLWFYLNGWGFFYGKIFYSTTIVDNNYFRWTIKVKSNFTWRYAESVHCRAILYFICPTNLIWSTGSQKKYLHYRNVVV